MATRRNERPRYWIAEGIRARNPRSGLIPFFYICVLCFFDGSFFILLSSRRTQKADVFLFGRATCCLLSTVFFVSAMPRVGATPILEKVERGWKKGDRGHEGGGGEKERQGRRRPPGSNSVSRSTPVSFPSGCATRRWRR